MSSTVRGWCPTLARPMESGDGLLVRVHAPTGGLGIEEVAALAATAQEFGNGTIQLTSRAALQIRGLSSTSLPGFASAMQDAGFDGAARRVLRSPLTGEDPDIAPSVPQLAASIESALAPMAALPEKFAVAVDGGGALPLGDAGCDIVVRAQRSGFSVALADTDFAVPVPQVGLVQMVLTLAQTFAALAGPGMRRMRDLLRQHGAETIWARAGLQPQLEHVPATRSPLGHVGLADGRIVVGLGLPFGTVPASVLTALAAGMGTCRLLPTPWRAFLLTGDESVAVAARAQSFITDPDDPLVRSYACHPDCRSATVPVQRDAACLAPLMAAGTLHVSGCAKGCAHPGPATVTLVGRDGAYDLIWHGGAQAEPVARGLTRADCLAALSA